MSDTEWDVDVEDGVEVEAEAEVDTEVDTVVDSDVDTKVDTMSNSEIRELNKKEAKKNAEQPVNTVQNPESEIRRMTAKEVQDFLVTNSTSVTMTAARVLQMKALQNVDSGYFQILQIHGFIKFNESMRLKSFLKDCMTQTAFINRLVKYAAQYCYSESNANSIMKWSHMMKCRTEYEWATAFNKSVLSSPDRETELLATQIMLLPNPSAKHASRVFSAIATKGVLPPCFEHLMKIIFRNVDHKLLAKADLETIIRIHLFGCYEKVLEWKQEENKKLAKGGVLYLKEQKMSIETEAQNKFLAISSQIANNTFGVIQNTFSDENAAQMFLQDPCFDVEKPSALFIEYFLQYTKLGMFPERSSDKMIAWNYYYDDRWCGYGRNDLFGDNAELSNCKKWFADFKHAGEIEDHPYHQQLIMTAKVYDWMRADPELFARLMEKYGCEDLIRYFSVALSFAGSFKQVLDLFNEYKDKVTSQTPFFSIRLCYLFSCAQEGMANEALVVWAEVMDAAIKANLLRTLKFKMNSFPLPFFVGISYVGQFATRLLRNCLWSAARKEGSEGWKKYATIILYLCDTLEETFLNHNMPRVMFQLMEANDLPFLLRPGLSKCFIHHKGYWDCLHIARKKGCELPQDMLDEVYIPLKKYADNDKPSDFLEVYRKFRKLDPMFYGVMNDLPMELFNEVDNGTKFALKEDVPEATREIIAKIVDFNNERNKEIRAEKKKQDELDREERKRLMKEYEEARRDLEEDEGDWHMKHRMRIHEETIRQGVVPLLALEEYPTYTFSRGDLSFDVDSEGDLEIDSDFEQNTEPAVEPIIQPQYDVPKIVPRMTVAERCRIIDPKEYNRYLHYEPLIRDDDEPPRTRSHPPIAQSDIPKGLYFIPLSQRTSFGSTQNHLAHLKDVVEKLPSFPDSDDQSSESNGYFSSEYDADSEMPSTESYDSL
ncbi:hypothetical protein B9Z55_024966 [Caenorhabditis nigoni]|uniref:Uncharacterized protein n=1 Tax=Caenorhabditis nigoni TaxID=1611254 RepID=A0A2G5SWP6_9PELO|nr:hypothetical protein B9Z55_024966 [Caenorhabditis nigoni]